MTDITEQGRVFLLNGKMFDKVIARACEIATESFRRMVFETKMNPAAVELVRDRAIEAMAERIVDQWADCAARRKERREP